MLPNTFTIISIASVGYNFIERTTHADDVHSLTHEHIGTLRQHHHLFRVAGITGEHDATVCALEAVGQGPMGHLLFGGVGVVSVFDG